MKKYIKYILIIVAIFFIFINIKNPSRMSDNNLLSAPSIHHVLGTDNLGRDIYTRLLWGTFNTLAISLLSILLSTVVGTIIGGISGYFGGYIDLALQTFIEIILSIPSILIAITVVVIMGSGFYSIIFAIFLMYLPLIVNYSRGLTIKEKDKEYIMAAKTYGVKNIRIILKHILPNIKKYVIINFVINFSKGILTEAGLGFLGIGIESSVPTLGNMLNISQSYFLVAPWFTLSAGIMIIILVYIANEIAKRGAN
ncbi:ABC transporter permease [Caviibacter abscessus]|uniref:ABC transporter permease n=1 Tax=Caviibacter abscessus TaxID=1766719 RepID=UPI0008398F27|nr:ABC transporter permease [Caviibacter abscessus]